MIMGHLYVISGNEFGADIGTKKNYHVEDLPMAVHDFLKRSENDDLCWLIEVDSEGNETLIEI